jgi:hypothetical protein
MWVNFTIIDISLLNCTYTLKQLNIPQHFAGTFGGRGGRPAPLGRGGIGRNPPNKQKNK